MSILNSDEKGHVTEGHARKELGRFFRLVRGHAAGGEVMPMFSSYVDAAWHRMLENPETYRAFCRKHAGRSVEHVESTGTGPVGWVSAYEAAYGPLPTVWFANADGSVDDEALAAYRRMGTMVTDWDCAPRPGPGDGDDVGAGKPSRPWPSRLSASR